MFKAKNPEMRAKKKKIFVREIVTICKKLYGPKFTVEMQQHVSENS